MIADSSIYIRVWICVQLNSVRSVETICSEKFRQNVNNAAVVIAHAAISSVAVFRVSAVSSPVNAFCRIDCLSSLSAAIFWR